MPRLIIGTAAWGLDYGIEGRGQTAPSAIAATINCARTSGVTTYDTAPAYGHAERVLGTCLDPADAVITKTPHVERSDRGTIDDRTIAEFDRTLAHSRDALRRPPAGLLLHNASDLLLPGAEQLVEWLTGLTSEGKVEAIGVSVYTVEEAWLAIERLPGLTIIQAPLNVFDQRFATFAAERPRSIELHVRSVFLQGVLLLAATALPPAVHHLEPAVRDLQRLAQDVGTSALGVALGYLRGIPGIDAWVTGVRNPAELGELVSHLDGDAITNLEFLAQDPRVVDPRTWS